MSTPPAAADSSSELFDRVYGELRGVARRQLAGQGSEWTLNPTALVHEVYLKLLKAEPLTDRQHLMRLAARAMRQLIIDRARRRRQLKRGGSEPELPLDPLEPGLVDLAEQAEQVLVVHRALRGLREEDPRLEQVVELRFFAGLSVEETAEALGISTPTVKRDSRLARAFLRRHLSAGASPDC
ncbi:MAG: ECF-type sigma factor [Acidobacteriota bacterium]